MADETTQRRRRLSGRERLVLVIGLTVAVALIVAAFVVSSRQQPASPLEPLVTVSAPAPEESNPILVRCVAGCALAALPEATTATTINGSPVDTSTSEPEHGLVAHNPRPVPVFTEPGGTAFARLPDRQLGSDTWLPVIAQEPGWVKLLLPNRPNPAAGWVDANAVEFARSPYEVRIALGPARLTLIRDGKPVGDWPISAGTSNTPTPTGRTFLLASITDPKQTFSPVILPLGIHSNVLDTYAGGPGTVAIHSWPTVTGGPASHGCVRVDKAALDALTDVPLGSIVRIDER